MEILPWNKSLLTRTVNFHGADLLSNLLSRHKDAIQNLDPNAITFRRFLERKEILKKYNPYIEEVIQFIFRKAMRLFKTTVKNYESEVKDILLLKDIHNCLPPLEYIMNVHPIICSEMFFRDVKKDDFLFGYIDDCPSEKIYSLNILSTVTPKHRYLKESNVKAFMRKEETDVEPGCRDQNGRWKVSTPLITQVLVVEKVGDSTAILVGTKDHQTAMDNDIKIQLGKASNDRLSSSIMNIIGHKLPTYDRCLENVGAFHSSNLWKKSLKRLSHNFSLDLKSSSTLMKLDIVPATLSQEDQYKLAKCCVAEGVSYYKAGENDKAMEALDAALILDKYHVDALLAKGTLLANLGRIEEALEEFELVLQRKPEHQKARHFACESLIQLAESCVEKGQMFEAEEKYQQCLGKYPENVAAREGLQKIGRPVVPLRRNTNPLSVIFENLPELLGKPPAKKQFMDPSTPYMSSIPGLLRDDPSTLEPGILDDDPFTHRSGILGDTPAMKRFMGPPNPYHLVEPSAKKQCMDPTTSYMTPRPGILGYTPTTARPGILEDDPSTPRPGLLGGDPAKKQFIAPSQPPQGGDGGDLPLGGPGGQDLGTLLYKVKHMNKATQLISDPNIQNIASMDAGKCRGGAKELHGSCVEEDGQICDQYLKGNCKFGASGHNCSKTHPRYCKTYLKKGKCPNGWLFCAKGPHPLVCKNSLTHGICNFKGCSYLHLNKTKNRMCPSKLGSLEFIVNGEKRKLDIEVDDNGPTKNEKIRKKKQKPLHRHYWRKLWQLKMARVEIRSMKEMMP